MTMEAAMTATGVTLVFDVSAPWLNRMIDRKVRRQVCA